jgi:pimeloyl-ACP methyl ester carboxylesterase
MLRVYNVTVPRPKTGLVYTEDDVKKMNVPALVFWTTHNPGSGPDTGEYYASLLPKGEYYLMQDAAHWAQWEHPEEHDRVTIDYLKK